MHMDIDIIECYVDDIREDGFKSIYDALLLKKKDIQ